MLLFIRESPSHPIHPRRKKDAHPQKPRHGKAVKISGDVFVFFVVCGVEKRGVCVVGHGGKVSCAWSEESEDVRLAGWLVVIPRVRRCDEGVSCRVLDIFISCQPLLIADRIPSPPSSSRAQQKKKRY